MWIEIRWRTPTQPCVSASLPAWECGLKLYFCVFSPKITSVTPCVGVWIEIPYSAFAFSSAVCHSLRGSVDWNWSASSCCFWSSCHSLRGSVDWNSPKIVSFPDLKSSLPAWECGLKSFTAELGSVLQASLPAWECGLKSTFFFCSWQTAPSHSLRGSVDWNNSTFQSLFRHNRHSLRGSVDWNHYCIRFYRVTWGHSLRGSVDWNLTRKMGRSPLRCHSLRGSVDWNIFGVS